MTNQATSTPTPTLKLTSKHLTVNGVKTPIQLAGPNCWIDGVDPDLIKVRSKKGVFPASFRQAFAVENNSDSQTDYFESDCIRLLPGDPLYNAALQAGRS